MIPKKNYSIKKKFLKKKKFSKKKFFVFNFIFQTRQMMLQKLMAMATWDYVPNDIGLDLTTDLAAWNQMQKIIHSLIPKQQEVNDLLVTAQVLAKERSFDSSSQTSWTNIAKGLNDINLDSFSGTQIQKSLTDVLWYYKEAQKHSFTDLVTAKFWFDFLQRLESIYEKQKDICIELGDRECEASDIYPFGPNNTVRDTAPFWLPIAKKLQECW